MNVNYYRLTHTLTHTYAIHNAKKKKYLKFLYNFKYFTINIYKKNFLKPLQEN